MSIKYIIQSSLTCSLVADILVLTTTTTLYIIEAKVGVQKYLLIVTLYLYLKGLQKQFYHIIT